MKLKNYIVKDDERGTYTLIKRKNVTHARKQYPGSKYTIWGPYSDEDIKNKNYSKRGMGPAVKFLTRSGS